MSGICSSSIWKESLPGVAVNFFFFFFFFFFFGATEPDSLSSESQLHLKLREDCFTPFADRGTGYFTVPVAVLKCFCAPLAKVGQMNETDRLFFEQVLDGGMLRHWAKLRNRR